MSDTIVVAAVFGQIQTLPKFLLREKIAMLFIVQFQAFAFRFLSANTEVSV